MLENERIISYPKKEAEDKEGREERLSLKLPSPQVFLPILLAQISSVHLPLNVHSSLLLVHFCLGVLSYTAEALRLRALKPPGVVRVVKSTDNLLSEFQMSHSFIFLYGLS